MLLKCLRQNSAPISWGLVSPKVVYIDRCLSSSSSSSSSFVVSIRMRANDIEIVVKLLLRNTLTHIEFIDHCVVPLCATVITISPKMLPFVDLNPKTINSICSSLSSERSRKLILRVPELFLQLLRIVVSVCWMVTYLCAKNFRPLEYVRIKRLI